MEQVRRVVSNHDTPLGAAKALGMSLPRFMAYCDVFDITLPGQKPTRPKDLPPP